MKKVCIGLAMAMAATMALGARIDTTGDGSWTNTPVVWSGGVPGAADTARVGHDVTLNTDSVIVDKLTVGRGTVGVLTISSGGNLIASNGVTIADTADGTLILNGGQMSVINGGLTLGADTEVGTLTLNTGSIDANTLAIGTDRNAPSTVNLFGGTFTVNNAAGLGIKNGGSVLNIQNDAQLILAGDALAAIDGFALTKILWADGSGMAGIGDSTWDNGSGSYLHAEFDGTNTTVWTNETIPEPATLGLVMMTATGLLVIRRRFML
ncbi:hypothetical protein PDESU_04322 [Pontiella desulfatans]|uniref:PEP-CTERM protein-sorting domain-containing protein n=2 Tax=Pontiella desulfatans TaxID=2750659 RepID=A0A6C2U7M1_PONDE|nr:hypothetical protein PDESU_04322 [Pontiella desulfatans]